MNASTPSSAGAPAITQTALEDQDSVYVLRCKLNEHLYSEVLSSIAKSGVALYGIRFFPDARGSALDVIAVIPLIEPVSADNSFACVEGDELVLTLPKAGWTPP